MPMKIRRTCQDVTRLVLESNDRSLGGLERLQLRLHWLACTRCRSFRRQQQLIRHALDQWRAYRNSGSDGPGSA